MQNIIDGIVPTRLAACIFFPVMQGIIGLPCLHVLHCVTCNISTTHTSVSLHFQS